MGCQRRLSTDGVNGRVFILKCTTQTSRLIRRLHFFRCNLFTCNVFRLLCSLNSVPSSVSSTSASLAYLVMCSISALVCEAVAHQVINNPVTSFALLVKM